MPTDPRAVLAAIQADGWAPHYSDCDRFRTYGYMTRQGDCDCTAERDRDAVVAALGAVLDLADKAEEYERKYIGTDSLAGEIWHGDLRAVIAEHLGGGT